MKAMQQQIDKQGLNEATGLDDATVSATPSPALMRSGHVKPCQQARGWRTAPCAAAASARQQPQRPCAASSSLPPCAFPIPADYKLPPVLPVQLDRLSQMEAMMEQLAGIEVKKTHDR